MAPVHVAALLAHPAVRSAIERALAARGNRGDVDIVHVNPREEAMLRMLGGSGTINPRTGLRQFDTGDPDAGGVGGSTGRDSLGGGGSTSGTNQGGYGHASDTGGGGYGPFGLAGEIPGAFGRALGDFGGFLGRAAGNFGAGWGNQGAAGGYGNAAGPYGRDSRSGSTGSGAGYGGGHSGQNYYSQTYGGLPPPDSGSQPPPLPQAPVINNLPPAPPPLTPMMSDTATTDLAGSRFGALPSFATTPYQIGEAPASYPTPGVNAGLGAPGYAGNPLPGQAGGGGGAPGGGGGAPGGGAPGGGAPGGPGQGGPYAPPPGSPQDYWAQMLARGQVKPSPALQAFYDAIRQHGGQGGQAQPPSGMNRPFQQDMNRPAGQPMLGGQTLTPFTPLSPGTKLIVRPGAKPAAASPLSLMQQMMALNAVRARSRGGGQSG